MKTHEMDVLDALDALEDEPLESHSRGLGSRPIRVLGGKMKEQTKLLSAQVVTRRELYSRRDRQE